MDQASLQPPPTVRRRHHFGYRANMFMLRTGGFFLPLGYVLVAFATIFFLMVDHKSRRASMAYLDRVLGHRGLLRRWIQTWWHFFTYGQLLLDRSVALAGPAGGFTCVCPDVANLERAASGNCGMLMLTAHFGAAELTAPMMKRLGTHRPFHFVIYRNLKDQTEQFHQQQWKALSNIQLINSSDPIAAGLKIIAALKAHEFVGLRADRAMSGRSVPATLLGATIRLPTGPFMAALLTGSAVVSAFTVRSGWRRYDMYVSSPRHGAAESGESRDQAIHRAAQTFASDLEAMIKRYPYQWGNFFDLWELPTERAESQMNVSSIVEQSSPSA